MFSLVVTDLVSETSADLNVSDSYSYIRVSGMAIGKAITGKIQERSASNWARVPDIRLARSPDTD